MVNVILISKVVSSGKPYAMKRSLLIPLLILAFSLSAPAQNTLKRGVPLLRESPKIDSLIKSVINIPANSKSLEDDSCILLGLFKNKNDAGFIGRLYKLNHKQILLDFSNFGKNRNHGYFEFNGYLIFVYGNDFMKEFFTNTQSKKEFTFINPTTQQLISQMRNSVGSFLFYKDGEFYSGVH